jgi:hypothetical protein
MARAIVKALDRPTQGRILITLITVLRGAKGGAAVKWSARTQ